MSFRYVILEEATHLLPLSEGDWCVALIAVPTAIAGFYGQNLPYPGFSQELGFVTSSVLIVTLSGGLYLAFKRKDWL